MNTLTDIHRVAKGTQKEAIGSLGDELLFKYRSPDEITRLQEQADILFPLLETCRRVGEIYAQHSAIYQKTDNPTLHIIDTGGFAPAYDTLLSLLKKSEKPL